jgi:tyrosinase
MNTALRRCLVIAAIALVLVVPGCSAAAEGMARSNPMEKRVLAAARPVVLGDAPTQVALAPITADETLASRAASLRQGRRLYLLIRGLRVDVDPGVIYNVYLDLPARAKPAANDRRHIGIINFYGVPPGSSPDRVFFSFDITDAARTLLGRKSLPDTTTVTFYPGSQAAKGASVTVARVEIVEE